MNRRPQSIHWDTREGARVHQDKVLRKVEKINTLRALLEMWEARDDADHDYILKLRAKLRSAENQLAAMSL